MPKLILRPILAALLGAALLAGPVAARDPRWQPFGPGGGMITGLAFDPRDSQVLYAATLQGVFGSRDGGGTWMGLSPSIPVAAVVVEPAHPDTIYAGGGLRILRSRDAGRSWQTVLNDSGLDVHALAVTPGQRPVVFALSGETIWRSADGGQTWTTLFISGWPLNSIAVDPRHPAVVYVANREGVLASSDAGSSWTQVLRLDLFGFSSGLVAVAPSSPEMLYLIASSGQGFSVYRSLDSGRSWWKVKTEPGLFFDRALVVDPRSPTKLYLAGFRGLLGSVDGGRIWRFLDRGMPKDVNGQNPGVVSLAIDPRQRRTVFAGLAEMGVARSDDGGGSWTIPVQPGLAAATIHYLAFHPLRPEEVFISLNVLADRGLKSTDGGQTWSFLPRQIVRPGLHEMAFDPMDADRFYAATGDGLWRTEDDGATWSRLLAGRVYLVATAGPGVVLAATAGCGLQRSQDSGLTWTTVIPCVDPENEELSQFVFQILANPEAPDVVYARVNRSSGTHSYRGPTFASDDQGATWRQLAFTPTLFAVAPADSRIVYAWELFRSLQRSRDGGRTWQEITARLPEGGNPYTSLAVDARDPDTIYLSTDRKVLRSRDGGRTLEVLDPSSFPGVWVATDRARPGVLFGFPGFGGLFELQVGE